VYENTRVDRVTANGGVEVRGVIKTYDQIVNVCGPWAIKLLEQSGIPHGCNLDLVRGSHLILDKTINCGVMLQDQETERLFFVLPYKGKTLLGTTEVNQRLGEPIKCSTSETNYLINGYNAYFEDTVTGNNVIDSFSGVRPLVRSNNDPNKASREYKIEKYRQVISVFGGKWTTSRALAKRVLAQIH
jgi:glycerol-3-phosphate dehydrogenase